MADKLRQGVSVETEFVAGETPSAAKLNSIPSQLRHAAEELEKAVGDIHDESYPYSTLTTDRLSLAWGRRRGVATALNNANRRELAIANLGRLVGSAANLNPRMLGGDAPITEDAPSGVHEFAVEYPIEGDLSLVTFSDGVVFANRVTAIANLTAAGDYWLNAEGRVVTFTSSAGGTVTYTTNPASYAGGMSHQAAKFNVVPDPNQLAAGGLGCGIGGIDASGRHTVTLPVITHQQSNLSGSLTTLDDKDVNYSQQAELPGAISGWTAGEEIPAGFLFLKNYTTNEVYTGATYYYVDQTSFQTSGIDLTDALAAGEEFLIFTVGSDITSSIDDLRIKQRHSHDRSFGEPFIDAASIVITWRPRAPRGSMFPVLGMGTLLPSTSTVMAISLRTQGPTTMGRCVATWSSGWMAPRLVGTLVPVEQPTVSSSAT